MLIGFSLENWMSFRDPVEFSMLASRERQHRDRVVRLDRHHAGILPIAVIYGGNAAGKTNFFAAMNFAQSLIVRGTQPDSLIPIEPFRLNAKGGGQPSRFRFELLIDGTVYEFGFAATRESIVEERLAIVAGSRASVLYHRRDGAPHFASSLARNKFLRFAFEGTRDNQLFLTNSVSQRVDRFQPVYDWFRDTLELIAPDSRFSPFERFLDDGHPLYAAMNEMLPRLDTGIARLGGEKIAFDNLPLPDFLKTKLREDVKEGMTVRVLAAPNDDRFVVARKDGELIAKKLVTYHPNADGVDVKFEIGQESDGSRRAIDLLPAFLNLSDRDASKVYVIDEVDRSLHTLLTRNLLEAYLATRSPEARAQLLLTTHDVQLMDQRLLRRDEMWVAERDATGSSALIAFSEYKDVRYDKDIRKSYLQGRMGGIPRIRPGGAAAPCGEEGKAIHAVS